MCTKDKSKIKISRRTFLRGSVAAIALLTTGGLLAGCNRGSKGSGQRVAVITQNKQQVESINLASEKETREIQLKGVNVVVQVEPGRIRFLKSDCRDQICVKAGWLDKEGDLAACLPNKAIIVVG